MGLKSKNPTRSRRTSPHRNFVTNSVVAELDEETDLEINADLTAKKRDDLDDSDFALPNRRYPIPDEAHAKNALSRVSQFGSPAEKSKVRAAVKRKFPDIDANSDKNHGASASLNSSLVNNDEDEDGFVENQLQEFTFNIGGPSLRYETLEGRNYMVAPTVMIVEGVLNGSNGPLFYPSSELRKTPAVWDHKPITLYHPTRNGSAVSGCDPAIISSQKLGLIFNTHYVPGRNGKPNKLSTEAWLEVNALKRKAPDVFNALKRGQKVEVSTGLFTDNSPEEGVWKGKRYDAIARNYRPDHLAVLPNVKGACSVDDGAGLMQNAQGEGAGQNSQIVDPNIRKQLDQQIKTRKTIPSGLRLAEGPPQPYLRDIYGTFCVYCLADKMFKQDYSTDGDGNVKLSGQPQEVTGKTQYMNTDGSVLNSEGVPMKTLNSRKDFVNALIENADWEESDRPFLMAVDKGKFIKICLNAGVVDNVTETRRDGQNYIGGKGEEGDEDDNGETVEDGAGQVKPKKMGSKSGATDNKGKKFPPNKGSGKTSLDDEQDDEYNDDDKAAMNMENMDPEEFILNSRMPASVKESSLLGLRMMNHEKQRLIKVITANSANKFGKDYLAQKPLDELQAIAALATNGQRQGRQQRGVLNFAGLGDVDSSPIDNAEEPLMAPVMNFERQTADRSN